jgi:ABC-2 type transport system permease protein
MRVRVVALVVRREIVERVRTRAYQISTLIVVAAVAVATALPHVLHDSQRHYKLGLAGRADAGSVTAAARGTGITLELRRVDRSTVPAELRRGSVQAVLVDERRLVVRRDLDPQLRALVQAALVGALPQVEVTRLDGPGPSSDTTNVAIGAVILLYFALICSGTWVASGIVEEKSSRVVEVVLSAVRPRELLAGKVLGIGAVALAQVAAATISATVTGFVSGAVRLPDNFPAAAASVIGWFVLGYALYACAFAAAASLVSRQEDLPAVTTPVTVVMAGAFLAALTSAEHPDTVLVHVLSLVPFFSPLLMPVRIAAGSVGAWELSAAVLLTVGLVAAVAWLAARLYADTALRGGARLPLRAALRGGAGRAVPTRAA